jgi:hypothetical protein
LQEIASSDLSEIKTENTFRPTILGTWENLSTNKESPYVFHVARHIVSKSHLRTSFKDEKDPLRKKYEINFHRSTDTHVVGIDRQNEDRSCIKQDYEVKLKVNHAMAHMPRKVKVIELSEDKRRNCVMEMSPSTTETT